MLHHYARLLRLACKPSIMAASSGSSSADLLTETTQRPTETAVHNALSQLRSPQASDLARSQQIRPGVEQENLAKNRLCSKHATWIPE